MKKSIYIAFFLLTTVAYGQANDPIDVDATGDREIEPAYRIALSPRIVDTTINTAIVNYPLLSLRYETSSEVERINPASIKTIEKLPKLYSSYVKLVSERN